ncbi:hypothetical protein HYW21_02775 [Candidatus Woesearchaeota archaeon]|nr:hypothetical protein [Candidatus Woesearchaeota archaeon]
MVNKTRTTEEISQDLLGWIEGFIKHKDLMLRKIVGLEKTANTLQVNYKDKEQLFIIAPVVDDLTKLLVPYETTKSIGIVLLNTKENLQAVLQHWNALKERRFLSLYFVNPFAEHDKQWIIFPYTHSRIGDDASLTLGLNTMFEQVGEVDMQRFKSTR